MSDWNSTQYTKFERERAQPSIDLINRLYIEAKTVLDIKQHRTAFQVFSRGGYPWH